jgi:hypothetical protein
MTDVREMRARLRDASPAPVSNAGGGGVPFWAVAAGAMIVGFAVVLFAPRLYSVQRTATLPAFQQAASRSDAASAEVPLVTPENPALRDPNRYVGKNVDEIGRIADAVCAQTSRAAGEIALLACRLTEAPARYCSRAQRQKITADIINHMRGIEQANAALAFNAKASPGALVAKVEPDPRVIEGIEGLMRGGYLMAPQRADIGANVPRPLREQFARVVGSLVACPEKPWWQVWK